MVAVGDRWGREDDGVAEDDRRMLSLLEGQEHGSPSKRPALGWRRSRPPKTPIPRAPPLIQIYHHHNHYQMPALFIISSSSSLL